SIGTVLLLIAGQASARPHPRPPQETKSGEELRTLPGEIGRSGGRLVVSLRAEPKTLNPLTAGDAISREVIFGAMQADLVHINRATQLPEPALAKSWRVSGDNLEYTLNLRKGLRFSDGHPVDADDVLFTFHVYLDENVHATQRDLLIIEGKPITVQKTDAWTVVFQLPKPYGVGERIFDGLPILPRHLLEKPYTEGKLAQTWTLATPANQWAGLGPFRLKEYVPGQRLVLERNPYYWKADAKGNRLPYLDELDFIFVPSSDAQVLRFQSGETDVISRLGAENFSVLSRQHRGFTMTDAGPGLEYNFLFFNLNDLGEKASPEIARKQKWFREVKFRQAVSLAIDRESIVRLVYQGRGAALWGPVTPGNRRWLNTALVHPPRSLDRARQLLKEAGFSWANGPNGEGALMDADGKPVEFSMLTSSSNADRTKMATLIQDDLKQLGMRVQVAPLEFRSLIDRVTQTKEYEACLLGLVSGDADANSDFNVWHSTGATHLWNPSQTHPATDWEAEIDRLMEQQHSAARFEQRKKFYDRVQEILAEKQPMIFLASPNILTGAKNTIGNFHPAVLEPYVLWNLEQLFVRNGAVGSGQ
ncbi:MAG TPA: ABC transporter substrate-binding protein, partial [Candidatus Dormibacteraeota bacterium]|nr:ABC transporter substrate-binding protein [Candidatus Dormibacteraeota bacterium]